MGTLPSESLRTQVLEAAKDFKLSWVELGRSLYSVYKEKMYKDWGFREFETYCAKELGIKFQTAQKLLKSYCFLEKEEPAYLKRETYEKKEPNRVPDYESVNVLRLAKNRKLEEEDYSGLRQKVLEEARPVETIKKEFKEILASKNDETHEEAETKRRQVLLKRTVSTLKTLRGELEAQDMLPKKKLSELEHFIEELEELVTQSA